MNERKLFGIGRERAVFEHPHSPKRLVREVRNGVVESEKTVKGRYYLTKVLHRLFPENIPDIHAATSLEPQSITVEKVHLDEKHEALRTLDIADYQGTITDADHMDLVKRGFEYEKHPAFKQLKLELSVLGVRIDRYATNFSLTEAGKAMYVDSFLPWSRTERLDGGGNSVIRLTRQYNPQAIHARIMHLPEAERAPALRDFQRLETLYLQESQRI